MKAKYLLITAGLLTAFSVKAETVNDTLETETLRPALVTGTRNLTDARHLPMTVSLVSRKELTKNYRSSVLPTVCEQVPGLFITSRGMLGYGVSTGAAGGIKVRGIGGGAEMLVLIDGQPQYAGLMGHPIADAYQTMMAEKVEVLRGPSSVLYGSNAMGGVMNIVTRKITRDGSHTTFQAEGGSYGTAQAQVSNQTKAGKFSSTAGINYERTDGHRPNSNFEQYSGFVKLGYDLSEHWKADADVNLTHFKASNPGEETNPYIDNDSKITRGLASVQLANNYGSMSGAIRAFYDWGHHNINDGYHPGGTPQTQLYLHNDIMSGITAYESTSLFEGNWITLGVDYQHFGGKAWNKVIATGEHKSLANKKQDEIAGYLDFRQDLLSLVTLDAGLRVDYHSTAGTELVPQGGLTFHINNDAQIRAMVSKGFRNPTIRELYMFRPANKNLKPERMTNYELAFSNNLFNNSLRLGLSLFYLKADNMITTAMVDGRPQNVNTGKTENSGVEFEAKYKADKHLSFNTNYSYLHMSNPTSGAPEHKLYVGADYVNGKFSASTGVQYIAGLYLAAGKNADKEYFTLWNLTASYKILKNITAYARGENLLAQKYQTMLGFTMPKATVMAGIKIDI